MKKDQHVIACVDRPQDADIVLAYARHYAECLNHKGIILLNVSSDGNADWIKEYGVPYIGLKGDWKTAIDGLPTAFGGILAVTAIDHNAPHGCLAHPHTLRRQFATCRSAYLVVHNDSNKSTPQFSRPTLATLTLDHRRESKEKLIWGSYIARFLGCRLTVASPDYKDEGLRQKWQNNMTFMDKMYRSLNVDYTTATIANKTFGNLDVTALDTLSTDLLVAMTTDARDRDVGDWLLGVPERKLLSHPSATPILLLNQRDDLYVLCD